MRIAEVAPLFFPVPPLKYGSVSRLVSYLTEELVSRGHDVTLFASGDSRTRARLVPACDTATGFGTDPGWHYVIQKAMVAKHAAEFDVIHLHEIGAGIHLFPMLRLLDTPCVVTYHAALPITEANTPFFREFADIPMVSLSNVQRRPAPWLNWRATIYHGLPTDLYQFREVPSSYLTFMGRICRHKNLEHAIQIARLAGRPLKIAGRPFTADDRAYFDCLRQTFDGAEIEYVGELDDAGKQPFLGNALALLLPLASDEPGPVVAFEALACGTPIIGYRRSFIPEIVMEGVTGFVVDDVQGAVEAVAAVEGIRRAGCREAFEKRFSIVEKAEEYLAVFEHLTASHAVPCRTARRR
jgi:glycosyltransferase involved in cell wall biosynthesis